MSNPRKWFVASGQRFGRWTVVDPDARKGRQVAAVVQCDCGQIKTVTLRTLACGNSQSCGCLRRKLASERGALPRTMFVTRGQRFGYLTLRREVRRPRRQAECVCDCGAVVTVSVSDLTSGHTKSCGCAKKQPRPDRWALTTKPGRRYGRLKVIDVDLRDSRGRRAARCMCNCGNTVTVDLVRLLSGDTRSCGCLKADLNKKHAPMLAAWARSAANRDRLRAIAQSPEHRARANQALAASARSPEGRERARRLGLRMWSVPRMGSLREAVDAPDTEMWCPTCGEPMRSLSAFDRHRRQAHQSA